MRMTSVILFLAAIPAFAADHWLRLSTPDFELYTTGSEKQGKDMLRHFEQVREFFLRASPVRSQGDFPLRIFLFNSVEAQFKPLPPERFHFRVFRPQPDVARDYIAVGNQAVDNFSSSIHEYMHLIVRHSGLKLPTWLNEGWADVYSTLRPMGKDFAVGDLLPDRMQSLAAEEWIDFRHSLRQSITVPQPTTKALVSASSMRRAGRWPTCFISPRNIKTTSVNSSWRSTTARARPKPVKSRSAARRACRFSGSPRLLRPQENLWNSVRGPRRKPRGSDCNRRFARLRRASRSRRSSCSRRQTRRCESGIREPRKGTGGSPGSRSIDR